MPTYDARVIPDISVVPNGHIREHCSAHQDQIITIGRDKGQQVRVERYAPDGVTIVDRALYTVVAVHNQEPDAVFVGYREPEATHYDLRNRLGLSGAEPVTGKINAQVPHPTLEDDKVKDNSEFVERFSDNGRHRGLIAIAPHGGDIERHTDEQAGRVGKQLSSKCVSVWICKGFKQGGGAFDCWHITSTDISAESFPQLKTVIGRNFEYAVAFHGWGHDSICVGGSAPADLRQQIKTAVEDAISGSGIAVETDEDGGCPEEFNGTSPKNIVNRLGANGIHIEQSIKARRDYGIHIADAVAAVIGARIEVCTAPVFDGSGAWACAIRRIAYSALLVSLTPLAWMPSIPCRIRPLRFRMRNCREGNKNPCIEL